MTSQEFKEQIKKLPDSPGVYFFLGKNKEILYIGKATSLCDRVKSYFSADLLETRSRLIADMVALADDIDFTETDSVLEALLLEANLIKYHQPKYNTDEKDNKSYNYVVITREDFPKIIIVRGRTLLQEKSLALEKLNAKYTFGPFPYSLQLREALKIVRRIFPYSDAKCVPYPEQVKKAQESGKDMSRFKPRPCFNRQISLCPGVCTGEISKEEYAERIQNIKLFFDGKKKTLLKNLEKQMGQHAKAQEFEKAAADRKTIFALNHIQDIALLKRIGKMGESAGGKFSDHDRQGIYRIEAYDIAHSSGTSVVGVMVVVEDDELNKSQYRKFRIKINPGINDPAALQEIIRRRLGHLEWPLPNLIVVDGAKAQLNAAAKVLEERGFNIELVAVVKDERHKPKEVIGKEGTVASHGRSILLANSEAHRFAIAYHRQKRDRLF